MIEVRGIRRTYTTGDGIEVHALRGVDLAIGAGEFMAIAGPSGSGKTTLLNLIGCIDAVDAGEIEISGEVVTTLDAHARTTFRRQKLGFIFQSYNLIPVLTAFENVALALQMLGLTDREITDRTNAMLAEVGLQGMENRLPSKLSGGQQQRVAVARALVKRPALVLADEPTANLDSTTGKAVLDLMETMNGKYGTTFVFSTHDQMVMEFAHRLVMLHDGEVSSDTRRA